MLKSTWNHQKRRQFFLVFFVFPFSCGKTCTQTKQTKTKTDNPNKQASNKTTTKPNFLLGFLQLACVFHPTPESLPTLLCPLCPLCLLCPCLLKPTIKHELSQATLFKKEDGVRCYEAVSAVLTRALLPFLFFPFPLLLTRLLFCLCVCFMLQAHEQP